MSDDYIERILERMEKDQTIFCPYCKEAQDNDDYQYPVSYHGDEDQMMSCQHCDKDFIVHEVVNRRYETRVKEKQNEY